MGQLAHAQVLQAKEAFGGRNVAVAQELVGLGGDTRRLNSQIIARAVEIGDDVDVREWAMYVVLVARCLERVASNAVDIAGQSVFVVTGLFREFAGELPLRWTASG
jgi:phosphate transport system protein